MSLILDGTNGLSDVDGTAGTPAIRGSDANTGVFFGTDIVGVSTGGSERMRVDASGNVGIGTSSFTFNNRLNIKQSTDTGASAFGLRVERQANDSLCFLGYRDNTNTWQLNATFSSTGAFAPITFHTSDAERARIDSSGNLLVGTTTSGAGAARAYVVGDATNPALRVLSNTATTSVYAGVFRHESTTAGAYIQFVTDGNAETGRIFDSGGTMQYASSSDARLKTNVQQMQNGLDSVLALNPCTFDMHRGENTIIASAGLIAQEVNEVYPYVVGVGGEDANTNPWSVDYGKLTPLLVSAIQELKAINDAQAQTIESLTARVVALEQA